MYEKLSWAVTRKSCNSNGDCAYAHGFPVLAEDPDVVVLRTSATNGDMSFCGEDRYCYTDQRPAARVSPKELITFTDKHLYTLPTHAHKLCKIIISIHMNRSVCTRIIYA